MKKNIDLSQYREDAQGRLVLISSIKAVDLERDELITALVEKHRELTAAINGFKKSSLATIDEFAQRSAREYGAKLGGKKGNIYLVSYDGRYKIVRAVQERFVFDERLQAAKSLIDQCLHEWCEGSKPEIRTLISDAFSVDKEGQISVHKILGLRKLNYEHKKWKRAMKAIDDSLHTAFSKIHLRFYERDQRGEYQPIA